MKATTLQFDDSMAIGTGFSRIRANGKWIDGAVFTPYGIVVVYSQGGNTNACHTRLDFVYRGRMIMRTIQRHYTGRGLAMLAKRFAREVAGK